jgi:hypothetical protein
MLFVVPFVVLLVALLASSFLAIAENETSNSPVNARTYESAECFWLCFNVDILTRSDFAIPLILRKSAQASDSSNAIASHTSAKGRVSIDGENNSDMAFID